MSRASVSRARTAKTAPRQLRASVGAAASAIRDLPLERLFSRFAPAVKPRWQLLLLGVIALIALIIRLYRLGDFPDTVLGDEADNAQAAARILLGRPPLGGFFGVDWTPQPAFSVYKQAAFLAVFGFNVLGLRMPSAVGSALTLIPFYFLLRRQISLPASLLATALFSTNVWYLNFSRSGWNNVDVCGYMVVAVLCVVLALDSLELARRHRRLTWFCFGLAGFATAMGLYAYPSGRAIPLAVAALFPLAWLTYERRRRDLATGFGVLIVVAAVVVAPHAWFAADHWERYNGRTNVVLIFNQPYFREDPGGTILAQLERNAQAPWVGAVNNTPQYSPPGEPQLDSFTGLLVPAGMLLSFLVARYRRQPVTWLWWLMLLTMWGLTQLLTAGTPNGARGIGYVPALFYFAGLGLEGLLIAVSTGVRWQGWSRRAQRAGLAVIVAATLAYAGLNVARYADWQSDSGTRRARYIYLTAQEFPRWAADITDRALRDRGITNLGEWRGVFPIADPANPYSDAS